MFLAAGIRDRLDVNNDFGGLRFSTERLQRPLDFLRRYFGRYGKN